MKALNRQIFVLYLQDIRSWILIFFLLRLIGIINPPLEIGHNWRQCLTLMISRNFYEDGLNMLYPKIDVAGNLSGIIGSEFPLYNFLMWLMYQIFGYHDWFGRLINLVVSSLGTYAFYALILKLTNRTHAFYSTLIFLCSIWFAFARKTMPDTISVSMVLIGLNCCVQYIQQGKISSWILFVFFISCGLLCKIPALSLVCGLSVILFIDEISWQRKRMVIFGTAVCIIIMSVWYFVWVPHLVETYQFKLYFPFTLSAGLKDILPYLNQFFEKFYFSALSSYIAFATFLIGLYFLIKQKQVYIQLSMLTITLIFFLFILKTGSVFPKHNYYIIPYVPVMAFLAGYFFTNVRRNYRIVVIAGVMIEAIANQQHDFFIHQQEKYKLSLENITRQFIQKNELVLLNGNYSNPQLMYFVHCKGWTVDNDAISTKQGIEFYKNLGAKFLVINKHTFADTNRFFPLVYEDKDIAICQLAQ